MRKLGKLPTIKKREVPFERRLQRELKKHDVLFAKLKPTLRGMPDRAAIGFGKIRLVEVKKEDGELSDVQTEFHKMLLKDYGVLVVIVHGPDVKAAARKIIEWLH